MEDIPKLTEKRLIKFIVTEIPETIANPEIYIAGEFNNWCPDMKEYRLKRTEYNRWEVDILTDLEYFQYKFSRGNWNVAECNKNGGQLPNRVHLANDSDTVTVEIMHWEDKRPTMTENVFVLSHDFLMPELKRKRRIWIYLPPDYNEALNKKYPVIYMQDGQNLFSEELSYSGEWGVDKTLNQLHYEDGFSAIVVGIESKAQLRRAEYIPWDNNSDAMGYSNFIAKTLKTYIDSHFRTLTDRKHTAIAGSSFGAISSFFTAIRFQEKFSRVCLFSPVLGVADKSFDFVQKEGKRNDMKMYLLAGLKESRLVIRDMQRLYEHLSIIGFTKNELRIVVRPDGEHREWFWRREFKQAVRWMFLSENINNP